ncbi:MAG: TonB-dependent receptor [Sandaracinaceae bacterium]|nr:TonB-dependent receptor [Sandaracinaceae bacterium]
MKAKIWTRAAGLALVLGLLGVASSVARADARTDARRHFRAGMALIAEGQVEEGVAELLQAFEILPHPNVLYNIGRAYAESGRYQQALSYFERYLDSDPPDRSEVVGFIQAVRARIAALEARSTEPAQPDTPRVVEPQVVDAAPIASEEEIAALEDSATQIDALAESTQSDALRQRAASLRAVAQALRERRSTASVASTDTGEPVPPDTGTGPVTDPAAAGTGEAPALVLGAQREGDTYEETVVSSSRAAQSPLEAPNATSIVTEQDIRLSGLYSFGETLRRVPGVDLMVTSPNNVQFSVRGLNQRLNNRAIVLIDGRSVYLDFVGGQFWSMIPLNAEDIERIEVIRGPASALYGADAFTGVVNIMTRQPGEGRSYVSAGIGNAGQQRVVAGVSQRIDRFRFRLSGGYETANQYSRMVGADRVDVQPFARNATQAYNRTIFNAEAQLRASDDISIRGGAAVANGDGTFQGLSRLREMNLEDALFAQTFLQVNTSFGLSGRVFWNRFTATAGPSHVRDGGLEGGGQRMNIERQDIVDTEIVYTNSFTIAPGIENQIIGGIGYRFKEIGWDWLANPVTGSTFHTQHHGNLFLQDTLRIEDVVQIVLSARGDLHPLFPEPQISPRGSVVIHPTPRQSIRVSAGTAFRSPTFVESYANVPNPTPLRGVTAFGVGDPTLNPERIVSVELGYMLQEFDFFALELTGYYNLVFDQILLSENTAYRIWDHQNNPYARYNPDLAAFPLGQLRFANEAADFQQIGGELGVRVFPVTGLDIYANYAIHETLVLGTAQTLEGRELDQRTSAHKFNAGIQYRSPQLDQATGLGFDLAADFHVVSDQVWVEQVIDTERGGTAFVPFELPAYALLNARIGIRFLGDQIELAATGTNLLMDGHRQHPLGQRVDRRFMGHITIRY